MHREILSKEQVDLLPFIKQFNRKFYLVGGTAIALHIGHRYSIDFDLFVEKPFSVSATHKKVTEESRFPYSILFQGNDQIHYLVNGVKLTFFHYPFGVKPESKFEDIIKLPSLLSLAAMKAFALGGRAKWKDYVDMYFLLRDHFTFGEISEHAYAIYPEGSFNSKLFRQQLSYYADVNYEETVFYLPGFEVSEEEIKSFLTDVSTRLM